jgi:hypothetical protein
VPPDLSTVEIASVRTVGAVSEDVRRRSGHRDDFLPVLVVVVTRGAGARAVVVSVDPPVVAPVTDEEVSTLA